MEEIKKIEVQGQQYGVADMLMRSVMGGNAQVIEWSHTHNMNDYKEAGTYRIKGERTGNPLSDNLPIMNQGSGHTIDGILYVLDSSLANGSGKESDCTITQFLMLSNRVGGQEGDMYMRSAYGANKDSLTWKPWEKYQTNMEVGCVSDDHLLNPSNPTEILKHASGMMQIIDNGIYSGVYLGPKCMVGTGEDDWHISFQDATAIETFVMVVINNYDAAKNAKCVTQIKFAVTNGGVFSMEKRSTNPGTTNGFSQWESVGGGGSSLISFSDNPSNPSLKGFLLSSPDAMDAFIGTAVNVSNDVTIGVKTQIGANTFIGGGVRISVGEGISLGSSVIIDPSNDVSPGAASCIIGTCTINAMPSDSITHNLNTTTIVKGAYLNAIIGTDTQLLGHYKEDSRSIRRTLVLGTGTLIGVPENEIPASSVIDGVVIGPNVSIAEGIHIGIKPGGDSIILIYNDKIAELPLTAR